MAGNRGFGDALADGYDKSAAKAPAASRAPLPTDSVLASRSTTLADLATGKLVNERTLWVDPARCKPWEYHNRDQAMLDETSCADLIDSFKAFPLLYVLTNGGPGTVTEVTNFYGFIQAFNFSYWGYGSAIAVVMLAIIFVLSAAISRLGRAGAAR